MHELIDHPRRGQQEIIQNLFVSSNEEPCRPGEGKPCKTSRGGAGRKKRLKANEKESEIISLFNGYGFIKDPPDNIFFHYTSLENKDFNALKVGEKVRLTVKTTQDGKVQADQVWVLE